MIDLSTRAEILHMMKAVQQEMELSASCTSRTTSPRPGIFTHRIAVMYLGRIVEIGPPDEVIESARAIPTRGRSSHAVCEPVAGKGAASQGAPDQGGDPLRGGNPAGLPLPPPVHVRAA